MHESILSVVGNTPLVELRQLFAGEDFRVFAKLESFNPGGSIKDRTALAIMENALESGRAQQWSVVVESSSGNMGIGLAQFCRYHGMRFICVVDPRAAARNLELLRVYGAEIELVSEPDPVSGEFLPARIERVRSLLRTIPESFWPNQYANQENPAAHFRTTMREVAASLAGRIDYLFVATSTCGTLRGCAEYVRGRGMKTRIVAVDALGSQIFSDFKAKRLLPGLGAGIRPPLLGDGSLVDECIHVTDLECVVGCRRLAAQEAILAGGSSGGVVSAVEKMKRRISAGAVCVVILPDRGERYLDTVFDDGWVHEHLGDIPEILAENRMTAVLVG
jgi:N-(2-amino-2-carboxyethyl)-L-glutamate synthase